MNHIKTVFSGIQPTGTLHLGNYFGAVRNWVALQSKPEFRRFYSIVDYHSISLRFISDSFQKLQDFPPSEDEVLKTAATLLACGIDPKKSCFFVQSHVPQHNELMWIFSCMTPLSWVNRMTQYKEKKMDHHNTSLALLSYPVLMAADIVLYKASHVPVGEDQTQHLELARRLVERLHRSSHPDTASKLEQSFPIPKQLSSNTPRIMSLQNVKQKMSKSDRSQKGIIYLTDDRSIIEKKLFKATTDSKGKITYTQKRPELANLLEMYAALNNITPQEAVSSLEEDNMYSFKLKLRDKLVEIRICPIGERMHKLLDEEDRLLELLEQGAKEAREEAEQNIKEIKEALGLIRL